MTIFTLGLTHWRYFQEDYTKMSTNDEKVEEVPIEEPVVEEDKEEVYADVELPEELPKVVDVPENAEEDGEEEIVEEGEEEGYSLAEFIEDFQTQLDTMAENFVDDESIPDVYKPATCKDYKTLSVLFDQFKKVEHSLTILLSNDPSFMTEEEEEKKEEDNKEEKKEKTDKKEVDKKKNDKRTYRQRINTIKAAKNIGVLFITIKRDMLNLLSGLAEKCNNDPDVLNSKNDEFKSFYSIAMYLYNFSDQLSKFISDYVQKLTQAEKEAGGRYNIATIIILSVALLGGVSMAVAGKIMRAKKSAQ